MPNYELGKDSALLVGCTPVSISEIGDVRYETLVVYPNPSSTRIDVRYEIRDKRNASIELYNTLGQRMYSSHISSATADKSPISIDVSNIPKGVYYLRVENQVVKVIVE